jgi:Ca2+-binding RTX toxin-like protein
MVSGDGGVDTMNGGTGTASNYYFVDGNDQVNGAGAFNVMIELVSGVAVQLGSAQYQDVQEFVGNSGNNVVTVANTDSNFVYLYGGAGNDTLSTGSGGGYLIGEGGTNVLTGGGGLNVFVADDGAGVDTMNGGSGSNVYFIDSNSTVHGGGTFNTVVELQQNVSLTLGSAALGSDIQEVVLNGGTNTVDFSSATSSVYLYGGAGTNTLFGGTGNDFLYGGAGTNTFGFKPGWGQDTIMDWTAGTNDQIDLTALATQGVHAITDLTQTIVNGSDVITSSHTGNNSITLNGFNNTLTASSFHFA